MPLKYADMCKVCHNHRTQNPSGICSRCQRLKGEKFCTVCGKVKTSHESGTCYKCRKGLGDGVAATKRLDNAIESTKLTLFILEKRKENESFANISKMCGLSKGACYERYIKACNRDNGVGGVDAVDGSYISIDEKQEKD